MYYVDEMLGLHGLVEVWDCGGVADIICSDVGDCNSRFVPVHSVGKFVVSFDLVGLLDFITRNEYPPRSDSRFVIRLLLVRQLWIHSRS